MDSAPAQQFRSALKRLCRSLLRWLLGAMFCLCATGGWSAPPPEETDAWHLLAQRVEALQFRRFIAEGNAEVRWGTRCVRAQRIEGDMETGWLVATGDVVFTDERGTLHATQTRINLLTREGELSDVRGEVEGIHITADVLRSDGSSLHMQNVTLTTCDRESPHFLLGARSLSLSSALRLRARQVSLSLWGNRYVTLPYLSRRIGGRQPSEPLLPQVGYSRRRGLMLYYTDILPQSGAQVRYGLRVFTRHDPEVRVDISRRLDGTRDDEPLPHLEPAERPAVSFLDTVSTTDWRVPADSRRRQGAFLSLRANSPVEGLQRTDLYLRGVELGYQFSQPAGGGLLETEWRFGWLKESPSLISATRAVALLRWQSGPVALGNQFSTDLTTDARAGAYSGGDSYGWLRAQWGVYWDSGGAIQAGAGLSVATTLGRSPFLFDELETRRDARFRLRFRGHWELDMLGIWDMEHHRWRDWQIALSPPAHCIQPRLLWSYQQRQVQLQVSLVTR